MKRAVRDLGNKHKREERIAPATQDLRRANYKGVTPVPREIHRERDLHGAR